MEFFKGENNLGGIEFGSGLGNIYWSSVRRSLRRRRLKS
jgi:hypothetical protein